MFIGGGPAGLTAALRLAREGLEMLLIDAGGFVKTDYMMTSMAGVFATGDVRAGSTKQALSTTGEGTTAALAVREYLKSLGE